MFIKKDTRKVLEILSDPEDDRTSLKLGRREAEFGGSTKLLCHKDNIPALARLEYLSLYSNKLTRLSRFGVFSSSPLRELNVGNNLLTSLPTSLGTLTTLEVLWAEDNQFEYFPPCVLQLKKLKQLRLSGNKISELPEEISTLSDLEDLALDNNKLTRLPDSIGRLSKLAKLVMRGNCLESLPDSIGDLTNITFLAINSNSLLRLPESIGGLVKLKTLFANKNQLETLPGSLAACGALEKGNFANCRIERLPSRLWREWADYLPKDLMRAFTSQADPGSGASGDAAVGHEASGGTAATPTSTPASVPGASPSAGAGGLAALLAGDSDDEGSKRQLDLDFLGNPISLDPGAALAESQFSQPLTDRWVKKLKS